MYRAAEPARSSRRSRTSRRSTTCILVVAVCCLPIRHAPAQSATPDEFSQTTEFRVFTRDWWPTKGSALSSAYAGNSACGKCHTEQASLQSATPMANASYRSAVGDWGKELAAAAPFRIGHYSYEIVPHVDDPELVVKSGNQSITAEIAWTFGAGVLGQTFVLESKGKLFDSQVSSFRGLDGGMAITPGHKPAKDGDLDNAIGMKLSPKIAARCFGCHTTISTVKDQFDPEHAIPGVTCESCHGPGLAHVVAANMNMIEDAKALIFSPRSLNPIEAVDFCGACHMTAADVVESNLFVPSNVRFAPYRLEKSRCWGVRGDQRLACFSCHDPHKPLVQEAGAYDRRCLSCHSSQASRSSDQAGAAAKACPKATANCTTCHMPKYDVPEMHGKFTDHFIRIVRASEPYPIQ